MVNYLKSIGKERIPHLFFNWTFVDNGRILLFLPGKDWSLGMICVCMTGI